MRNVSVSETISEFATGACDGEINRDYPHHIERCKIIGSETPLKAVVYDFSSK